VAGLENSPAFRSDSGEDNSNSFMDGGSRTQPDKRYILKAIGTIHEVQTINDAYRQMEAMNFSKGLLENFSVENASRLMVLRVLDVFWSDWGSEQRIMSDLRMAGSQEPRHGTKKHKSRKVAHRNRTMPSVR